MILRALFVALWWAGAATGALPPLSAGAADDECALYLTGRSSAYDYSLNLLRGNFAYEGQHSCITYEAINQAYLEARKRILVAQPKGDWTPEDYASVGELVLDISTNLARRYGLSYEEIEKGLPLIDTSRTLIAEVCPPVFSHVECRAGKYRRLDGLCNNLEHPTWGSTNVPFQRLIGPLFADGINSPRVAHSGRDLPLSRVVSRTIHPDEGFHDHAGTVMVIAWGQFMDHDYTLTATPLDPRNRNDPEECCKRPLHQKHPYCNEIRIPDDDYFYRLFGVKCIDFVRAFPSPRPGCRLGSRIPYNTLTGVLDGNTVYGVTDKFARKLRTGYGGLLRMNDVFKEYGLRDLLPLKLDIPDEGCTRPNKNMYCFEAGEIRVNEQLVLTVMHTLMAREHNRVAKGLAEVNPHWDDETLYQEARRINIAEIQHITYNEFLPILLGKDVMDKFGLVLEKEGYWDGYDTNVNPDVIASFASAAYRFGHSLLPTAIERWSKAHKFIASKRLSDLIRRPYDLYRAGVLDEYIMGLMNQVAQAMDDSITQEVTNHLFKKVGARFGMDLVSFNMQRGREFGIPGYMEFRKFCGLSGADTFQDLFGSMPNATVRKYESIFENPIDVDLWSGGVSERPLPGSMLGPTFACIIATQFSYSRRGDRFWYELPNQPSSFTPQQLKEVRKARMARVICDNTDIIDTVQLYPMVLPDHELNPRVPCRSGIIPSMDFSAWAEQPPFASPAKQFITVAITEKKTIAAWPQNYTTTEETKCIGNNTKGAACNVSDNMLFDDAERKTEVNEKQNTHNYSSENKTQGKGGDTVLNYLMKNDKQLEVTKNKAHPKNSLKRRRRNAENYRQNNKQPLIVNYQTSHSDEKTNNLDHLPRRQNYELFPPGPELGLLPLPSNTEKFIKKSDLASFDIKTLHDHILNPRFDDEEEDDISDKSREKSDNTRQDNEDEDETKSHHSRPQSKQDGDDYITAPIHNEKPYGPVYAKFHPEILSKHGSDETSSKIEDSDPKSQESFDRSLSEEEKLKSDENSDDDENAYRKRFQYVASELQSKKPESDEKDKNQSENDDSEAHDEKSTAPFKKKPRVTDHNSSEENRSDSSEVTDSQELPHYDRPRSNYAGNPNSDEISHEKVQPNSDDHKKEKITNNYKSDEQHSDSGSEEGDDKQRDSKKPSLISRENSDDVDKEDNSRRNYHNPKYLGQESNENDNKSIKESENYSQENGKYDSVREQDSEIPNPNDEDERLSKLNNQPFFFNGKSNNDNQDRFSPNENETDNQDNSEHDLSEPLKYKKDDTTSNEDYSSKEIPNPVKINDEEIKPVVELDSENDSKSKDDTQLKVDREVLADLHDYKGRQIPITSADDPVIIKLSDDIKIPQKDNKSVKQEFERIPLDYNHDKNVQQDDESDNKEQSEEINDSSESKIPAQKKDKVNDVSSTKDNSQFDEHLNFKFSDTDLKLPEIKLPDDILTYNEPEINKDKTNFYHHENEKETEEEEEDDNIKNEDDKRKKDKGNNNDYYNTNSHEDLRNEDEKDEEKEEEEDLYEKFVRERFGKKHSFEKRAENLLQQRLFPIDPALQDQVQKVLKRAEETGKQAENSGDPNAGFLWTLEYKQKL